jgi:hypothetical protein
MHGKQTTNAAPWTSRKSAPVAPRDGIPPIDHPKFIPPSEADAWVKDNEPVIAFAQGGEARAYPLQILTWHEIVNDVVGGTPVTITFCPCATPPSPTTARWITRSTISARAGCCGTATS